jgi:hypothetical protein
MAIGALLVITVGAFFLPALDVFLVGDDFEWLDAAFEIFDRPMSSFELINMMWRPVVKWTFLVDYLLFGRNSIGYAATNLAIHMLNTCLLYLLLSRLQNIRLLAAAAAAGFALSPLHSGAVLWASSRGDTLLLTSWLAVLLALIAWPSDSRRAQAVVLIVGLIGAGAKESWVVFPFVGTLFLVAVQGLSLRTAMKRMGWLWLALALYLGYFVVLPAASGASTAAYYADFSPLPALEKVCRLILSFCGLGGLELDGVIAVGLAGLVTAAGVATAAHQRNRPALWAIMWTAVTLALAAPFPDLASRHNYLPLAGFCRQWMLRALVATTAVALLVTEGLALRREIGDYRRYGRLHRELVAMLEPVVPQIPRDRPLLFIDSSGRRAVDELADAVVGIDKIFFVRRDAIWQMVFLPPLVNFLGDPFEERLLPVPDEEVPRVLSGDVTVLVFTDGGFQFASGLPDGLEENVAAAGRLPEAIGVYRFHSHRQSLE